MGSAANWFFAGLCLLVGLIFAFSLWLFGLDYGQFCDYLLTWSGQAAYRDYLQTRLFPPQHFPALRWALLLAAGAAGLGLLIFYQKITAYLGGLLAFFAFLGSEGKKSLFFFGQLSSSYRWGMAALLLAYALHSGFNCWYYELQYDEAWTYNHFVSKGWFASAFSPHNNHILYSLLACATDWLPVEGKYALRLPALLVGFGLAWQFLYLTFRLWDEKLAFWAGIWLLFSPSVVFYSLYARGYGLLLLFAFLAFAVFIKLVKDGQNGENRHYWAAYSLFNLLGFYSLPSYFYPFLGLNLLFLGWIVGYNRRAYIYRSYLLGAWLRANLKTLLGLLVLYLPFLAGGGWRILAEASEQTDKLPARFFYLNKMSDWLLLGKDFSLLYPFGCLLALGLAWIFYRFMPRIKPKYSLLLLHFLLNFAILSLSPTNTPERTWVFLSLNGSLLLGWGWWKLLQFAHLGTIAKPILAVCLLLGLVYNSQTHYHLRWSERLDKEAKLVAELILREDFEDIYCFSRYDKPLLGYYIHKKRRTVPPIYMPFAESRDFRPLSDKKYGWLLLDTDDYQPTAADYEQIQRFGYQLRYQSGRLRLYR